MGLECVVVGVDGSDSATRAVEFACRTLSSTSGLLVVVAAFLERSELSDVDNRVFGREASVHAEEMAMLARNAGFASRVVVRSGDPATVITQVAAEQGADLIVVGTRGRSTVMRALLGSVANALTSDSAFPTAVVH